jgi:hypothetical protein
MPNPTQIGFHRWAVGAELVVDHRHRICIRERPQNRPPYIARQQLRAGKHHDTEHSQGKQAQPQPMPNLSCEVI